MRVKEILSESAREFGSSKSTTMPTTWAFPQMPSANPYRAYRFGMAMANHELSHETGPADQFAVITAYTPGDEAIIDAAVKKTGEPRVRIADPGSKEPNTTNKTSPTARPKRNRFGV